MKCFIISLLSLFVLVLLINSVHAESSEKVLVRDIDHCYNISIRSHFDNGNRSFPLSFKNCNLVSGIWSNGLWNCNCYSSGYNNITIVSDKAISSKNYQANMYSLDIQYYTFQLTNYSGENILFDYGDYATLKGSIDEYENTRFCIPNYVYVYKNYTNTVYVNQTVYVDRNITSYVDVVREINNTVYVNQTLVINNVTYVTNSTKYDEIIEHNYKVQTNLIILFSITFFIIGIAFSKFIKF